MKIKKYLIIAGILIVILLAGLAFRAFQIHTDSLFGLKVLGDGAGGAFAIYENHLGGDIYVQKISPDGKFLWGEKGVILGSSHSHTYCFNFLQIAPADSGGGIIVEWLEVSEAPQIKVTYHLNILDSNGQVLSRQDLDSAEPLAAAGAKIHFQVSEIAGTNGFPQDILVQKLDAAGNQLWSVRLGIDQAGGKPIPDDTFAVSDGAGGAIVSWRDFRNPSPDHTSIYAQRIDADGNLKWEAGGIEVFITSPNPRSSMVSDGQGGAAIAYSFQENGGDQQGLHLQKVDGQGRSVWQENGIVVTEATYAGQDIAPDGQGGIIVGWGVGMSMLGSEKAFVQRIDSSGKLVWGENGIRLNP